MIQNIDSIQNAKKKQSLDTTISKKIDSIQDSAFASSKLVVSVFEQYSELIEFGKMKISSIKINVIMKILGFNQDTKEQLMALAKDKQINDKIKAYINDHNVSDLRVMFKNKTHQDSLINIVKKYADTNAYPKVSALLDKKFVINEIKDYMSNIK